MRLLLLLVALPAFAQQVPPRSFYELPSSNGHGAVMVDARTGRLVHFREQLPATEEPELDAQGNERWIGNQPQYVKSRDLLFDTPIEQRYDAALGKLGITRASLSSTAGNA